MSLGGSLPEVLTDQLRAERTIERAEHLRSSRWYASDAQGCWRQRWYKAEQVEPDAGSEPDARGILAMDVGSFIHERIQAAILAADPSAQAEVPWRAGPLGGRADLLVRVGSALVVGEIKTLSGYGFRRAKKEGPESRHLLQAMQSAVSLEASGVWLIYVSRDTLEVAEWREPVNAEWVQNERDEIALVEQRGMLPHRVIPGWDAVADPIAADAPWQCRYCAYRFRCEWDGE